MQGGGRLGGGISVKDKTPRELAAEAAERRSRDEKACGSGHRESAEKEAQRAAQNSVVDVIDVDALPDSLHRDESSPDIIISNDATRPERHSSKPALVASGSLTAGEWTCEVCTLINVPLALQCNACLMQRPRSSEAGWTCLSCGFQETSGEYWSCRECGWVQLK